MAFGAKSTEFMAPPDFAFRLMREATLKLALSDSKVRSLINPRQSTPITYQASPLNEPEQGEWTNAQAAPGSPAPEACLSGFPGSQKPCHLTSRFGAGLVALLFNLSEAKGWTQTLADVGIEAIAINPSTDTLGQAWQRYGLPDANAQSLVLVRPDAYVLGRWRAPVFSEILQALKSSALTFDHHPASAA